MLEVKIDSRQEAEKTKPVELKLRIADHGQAVNLLGERDENLTFMEKALGVRMVARGEDLTVYGDSQTLEQARRVLEELMVLAKSDITITPASIHYAIKMFGSGQTASGSDISFGQLAKSIYTTPRGKQIKPKTFGQRQYVESIQKHDITFGIGPAGTGKTYLAVVAAVNALKHREVGKIVLVRPAVEAGEKLGFLPGDLQEKVDPYLRPVYDALDDVLGAETSAKYLERGQVEVAPLAYMRGRTLDEAFIILDEAQNTTPQQMKMFLTRMGQGSKTVITGDITQIDLPKGQTSGLMEAIKLLFTIPEIAFCYLSGVDVVRHPLVQKIIDAYEKQGKRRLEDEN